jgi:hypothetical protein
MHLDLNEWLRGERDWRDLFDLEPYLRRQQGSAYFAALIEDEDMAEAMVGPDGELDLPEPPENPPHFGWTPKRADDAEIKDLLWKLIYVTARSEKKPPEVSRPKSAVEQVKERIAKIRHSGFVQKLGFKD